MSCNVLVMENQMCCVLQILDSIKFVFKNDDNVVNIETIF